MCERCGYPDHFVEKAERSERTLRTRFALCDRRYSTRDVLEKFISGELPWNRIYLNRVSAERDKYPTERVFVLKLDCTAQGIDPIPQCAHGNFVGYCAACAGEEIAK
jgi:hypothetical protein